MKISKVKIVQKEYVRGVPSLLRSFEVWRPQEAGAQSYELIHPTYRERHIEALRIAMMMVMVCLPYERARNLLRHGWFTTFFCVLLGCRGGA
jgi:hypothetical protein